MCICFYTIGIENTCWQTKNCMKIKIFKQFLTKSFTSSISKKNIIRKNDSGSSSVFKHNHHVL